MILGAGFSFVGGLPLASMLFEGGEEPAAKKGFDQNAMQRVKDAYTIWKKKHPNSGAEQYLSFLYDTSFSKDLFGHEIHDQLWNQTISYVLRKLVKVTNATHEPYY